MKAALAVHADWSVRAEKRWMCLAAPAGPGWVVGAPELVPAPEALLGSLLARAGGGAVALGIDCPIGVPRAYAASLRGTAPGAADFPGFLRLLPAGFWQVAATLAEIGVERPFYPARGVKGMSRASHAAALGFAGAADLSRLCDRATASRPAGAPVFWTLGANQSGKAAISAWRDVLIPGLAAPSPLRLWPFDGNFLELLAPGRVVVAETYPAEAMRHLGLLVRGSKRRQADRAAYAGAILAAMERLAARASAGLATALSDGFGGGAAGEDRFDSLLGVLCVIGVLQGVRSDAAPADPWITRWEGWVLGQTEVPVKV